jgi:hypothetical protein
MGTVLIAMRMQGETLVTTVRGVVVEVIKHNLRVQSEGKVKGK